MYIVYVYIYIYNVHLHICTYDVNDSYMFVISINPMADSVKNPHSSPVFTADRQLSGRSASSSTGAGEGRDEALMPPAMGAVGFSWRLSHNCSFFKKRLQLYPSIISVL